MIPVDREKLLAVLGVVLGVPTLLQITPIKINPWSWLWKLLKSAWRGFCRSLTSPVLEQIEANREQLTALDRKLTAHIDLDDQREADKVRGAILRFNHEVMQNQRHTEEEFVEVLAQIDWYNDFCKDHKKYQNSRAVHAIANVERVYDDRLRNNDFL